MKKQGWQPLLGLCLVGMLALAGCGGQAPTKDSGQNVALLLQQAREALAAADSYTADFSASVRSAGEDGMRVTAEICYVQEPLYMQVDSVTEVEETAQQMSTYLVEDGADAAIYMQYGRQWTEMTMGRENAVSTLQIYRIRDTAIALLDAAQDIRIAAQTDDTMELTATLPQERLFDFQGETQVLRLTGLGDLPDSAFLHTGDVPIRLTLDRKARTLLSYELDLREAAEVVMNDVLAELSGGLLEDAVTMEEYTIAATLHQLGGVEPREIPPEARSNAVNYEEEFYLMEQE